MKNGFTDFHRLGFDERLQRVLQQTNHSALPMLQDSHAEQMIENAIGIFGLPLGVVSTLLINDEALLVPMVVEEPSIIASCNFMGKLVARSGGFKAQSGPSLMVGQIQLLDLDDVEKTMREIAEKEAEIVELANRFCPNMLARQGGCLGIQLRPLMPLKNGRHAHFDNDKPMLIVNLKIDCRDAMGANIVNTIAEGVAPLIEQISNARAGAKILSNYAVERLASASCRVDYLHLSRQKTFEDGRRVARNMVDIYRLAARDPFRACTHNKGIMNGIDAVCIATGNDWRALEAGAHAFAARDGQYSSLSSYEVDDEAGILHANLTLPIAVGIVGGSTKVHPTVQIALQMLGRFGQSAAGLSQVLASVGLAQNMAALRALGDEGIQKGHMALHNRKASV